MRQDRLSNQSEYGADRDAHKVLYQSAGVNNGFTTIYVILSIILLIFAIACFHMTKYVRKGETEPVILMGIVMLACGAGMLSYAIFFRKALNHCWLKIYENHVEHYGGGMNDYYSVPIGQINAVQMFKLGIVIQEAGAKRKIYCREPQQVFNLLKKLTNGEYKGDISN